MMNVSLDFIDEQVRGCTLCPLHKSRTIAVPGEGPGTASIMFIGESPGEEEDRQGRPFAGRSGKVLDDALQSAGLNRQAVFITNVVKCHPPENRPPHQLEMNTCISHYLYAQIELINPRIICLLGNTAANALLGKADMAKVRGQLIHRQRTYLITYHPAAAGRSTKWRTAFFNDIKKLSDVL
jgi:DNA polymerase